MKLFRTIVLSLCAIGFLVVMASSLQNPSDGKSAQAFGTLIVMLAVFAGMGWIAWRGFVFLRLLFAPVRNFIKPAMDPINDHVESTLRRSGLGKFADFAKSIDAGIEGAVKKTQDGLDSRRK